MTRIYDMLKNGYNLYTVYGRNTSKIKKVEEVGTGAINKAIDEILGHFLEYGNIEIPEDDDEAYNRFIDKKTEVINAYILDRLSNEKCIYLGDYMLIIANECPSEYPNSCGYDEDIIGLYE